MDKSSSMHLWIAKSSFKMILWKRKQKYGTLEEQTGDLIIMRVELKENGKKTKETLNN